MKSILVSVFAALLGLTLLTGCSTDHGSPEATFAQMMIPHHEQAIVMADLALANNAGPEVSALAITIQSTQGPEIDQMRGILERYGVEEVHSHDDHDMPGMLTDEQLGALTSARGAEFDQLFLEGMILHHEGAIVMAEEVLGQTEDPEVRSLAQSIIDAQRSEIDQMRMMLGSAQ